MENEINKEKLTEVYSSIHELVLSIKMCNNWINLVPSPNGMSMEDRAFHYLYTYGSLDDLFEINQRNIDKLNAITSFLIGLKDDLE